MTLIKKKTPLSLPLKPRTTLKHNDHAPSKARFGGTIFLRRTSHTPLVPLNTFLWIFHLGTWQSQ